MNTHKQSGFSITVVIVIIVVVAALGFTALVVSLKQQAESANKQDNTTATKPGAGTITKTPASTDYTTYLNTALGFSLAYPKDWGALTLTGDTASLPTSGTVPALQNNRSYPFHQGALHFTVDSKANYTITGQLKAATYVPVLKNSTYSNYVWKVIAVDPADITDKVGDIYNAPVSTSDSGAQLYDFNFNEGDNNTKRWVFETKAGFVTLMLPAFGPNNNQQPTAMDANAHQAISEAIRKSVQLIY